MIDWLACLCVKALSSVLCHLPPQAAIWLGVRCGDLAYVLGLKRTRIARLNVRAAFQGQLDPAQTRRIVRQSYRQLGAGILELLRLPVMDRAYIDRYVTLKDRRYLESVVASGRPVVVLSAHYGNWELCPIIGALIGYDVVALARAQQKLPKLYALLIAYRESKGCTIVHKGGGMRRLIQALEQRQLVGIVGDQATRQGVWAEFFGRPALFAPGAFQLAHRKGALLLPFFMHRVRGPYHDGCFEPPIDLAGAASEAEAVQQGADAFAAVLAKHITRDPGQWLWMHKRWKHTPARRVLVLSDGKLGHVKQSLAVARALQAEQPAVQHEVVEIRYRHRLARTLALLWSAAWPGLWPTAILRWTLQPQSAAALLSRYADLIISCGAATLPANVLWARANQAKSVTLMKPGPLPLRRFDLVIAPRHDALPPRANVLQVMGAIAPVMTGTAAQQARQRLMQHPRHQPSSAQTSISVLLGGETPEYACPLTFVQQLVGGVLQAAEATQSDVRITTSRRTPATVEAWLREAVETAPRCRLLLLASRDELQGTMEGLIAAAQVVVVTGESVSMVSEACAGTSRVVVVEPPRHPHNGRARTKHRRFLEALAVEGHVRLAAPGQVSPAVLQALAQPATTLPLDNLTPIRAALARLL